MKGQVILMYKDQKQAKNAEKLRQKLDNEQVPMFMRIYLEDIKSKAGALTYWNAIRDFLLWLMRENITKEKNIKDMKAESFNDLLPQHVSMYLQHKEDNGMSPTTTETRRNIIRSFLTHISYLQGSIIGNINAFYSRVRYRGVSSGNNLVSKMPTKEQLEDMRTKIMLNKNEFVRKRNIAVYELFKGTGIRESELAGLDMKNLHLDDDIPNMKILPKGKYREMELHTVYLTGKAYNALIDWLQFRTNLVGIVDEEAVFVNKTGTRMVEKNIENIFNIYGCGITPHMLRHYCATVLASTGNIVFAQQQLGHAAMKTTVDNYANGVTGMKDILMNM